MLSDHIPVRHAYLSQLCRLSLLLLVMEDLVLSPFSCFSYCLCYTTRWRTPSLCWAEPGRLHWNSFCCSLQSCESLFCIHYTSGPHAAAVVELQHPECPAACRPLHDLIVTVISCVQSVVPGESSEMSDFVHLG